MQREQIPGPHQRQRSRIVSAAENCQYLGMNLADAQSARAVWLSHAQKPSKKIVACASARVDAPGNHAIDAIIQILECARSRATPDISPWKIDERSKIKQCQICFSLIASEQPFHDSIELAAIGRKNDSTDNRTSQRSHLCGN